MNKILIFLFLLFFFNKNADSQSAAIGGWNAHMPFMNGLEVISAEDKIYCAARSGIFYLDKQDNSLNTITRVQGLSEVGIVAMAYDLRRNNVIVGYDNSNIDIIQDRHIINVRDIKEKEIIGKKGINSITVLNDSAYINCGFGSVIYDLKKNEIRDTYFLGENGTNLAIYEVAILNGRIYAATDSGILEANVSDPNLANFQRWERHGVNKNYPGGYATNVVAFNNKLYAMIQYKVYEYDGNTWSIPINIYQPDARKLKVSNNKLLVMTFYSSISYNTELNTVDVFMDSDYGISSAGYDSDDELWIADELNGLEKINEGIIESYYYPSSPFDLPARRLSIDENKVIVAPGSVGDNYNNRYNFSGFYRLNNYLWENYNHFNTGALDTVRDVIVTAIDPVTKSEYIGTFGKGVYEFKEGVVINVFNQYNSTLQEALGNPGQCRISGMAFDSKNNLWVSNYWAEKPISVKRKNGQWQSFSFPGIFDEYKYVSDLIVDRNDQKWVVVARRNAILVFKEQANGTISYKKLISGIGNGNLPSEATEVLAIAEDLNGIIWVGTNKGLVTFYNSSSILEPGADIDAQPVKVVDGEFVQDLLGNETITVIKVDGANRKWIGTRNGVWLFSPDGTKQIEYFNETNSPLLSNKINDIAINKATGEVYFATDKGIISYRGTATEGREVNADHITVFPNPVRENYEGLIAINGLVRNANVKITDIAGNIVYQAIANGGQAVWNGKNFQGEKVSSGIYMAFCTDDEGNETIIKKIAFIK